MMKSRISAKSKVRPQQPQNPPLTLQQYIRQGGPTPQTKVVESTFTTAQAPTQAPAIVRKINPSIVLLAFNKHIAVELSERIKGNSPLLTGTEEQTAIWDEAMKGTKHIQVQAVAGSGKTETCIQYCRRVGSNADAMTYHSLGNKALSKAFGRCQLDQYKVWSLVDSMGRLPVTSLQEKVFKARIAKVVELAKQYGKSERQDLEWMVDHHDVELNGMEEMVLDWVPKVLERCKEVTRFIDFNDMIWLPWVLQLPMPRYDIVISDEAQDLNVIQQQLALNAGDRHIVVGDSHQCHPAGTIIEVTGGKQKPIEDLRIGEQVVSYYSHKSNFRGLKSQGRKIEALHKEKFKGQLVQLIAGRSMVECTPNHRWLVRLSSDRKECFALYLMVRGHQARVGICRLQYKHCSGIGARSRTEKAEKSWILAAFDTLREARLAELVTQTRFGLPSLVFEKNSNSTAGAEPEFIADVYSGLGNLIPRAITCLEYFGRLFEYPLWNNSADFSKRASVYSFVTEACNLVSGYMNVKLFDGSIHGGKWAMVKIRHRKFDGYVYGIQVQPTEGGRRLYVANGIVSHNSIYSFRGADSKSMGNMFDLLAKTERGIVSMPLTLTRRCPKQHVRLAQLLVPQIKAMDTAPEGRVSEMTKDEAIKAMRPGDMVLCRVNADLMMTAYQLLKRGVKAVVRGKDIGKGITYLIEKAETQFQSDLPEMKNRGWLSTAELIQHAGTITDKDVEKLLAIPHGRGEMRAELAKDKYSCLLSLSQDTENSEQVKDRIKELFKDFDKEGQPNEAVVLSSVHRGKGLEAGRVFVLRPDLMPHPASKQAHEIEQERNLAYVAVTRVKFSKESEGELVWVGGQSKLFGAKPEQNGYQSVDELPLSVDSVGAQFEQYKHGRIKQLRRDVQQ